MFVAAENQVQRLMRARMRQLMGRSANDKITIRDYVDRSERAARMLTAQQQLDPPAKKLSKTKLAEWLNGSDASISPGAVTVLAATLSTINDIQGRNDDEPELTTTEQEVRDAFAATRGSTRGAVQVPSWWNDPRQLPDWALNDVFRFAAGYRRAILEQPPDDVDPDPDDDPGGAAGDSPGGNPNGPPPRTEQPSFTSNGSAGPHTIDGGAVQS